MKNTTVSVVSVLLVLISLISFAGCTPSEGVEKTGLWENAVYLENQTFGEGKNTVTVEVKAEEQSVTFNVKTDEETVGAALLEHKLIDGDNSEYGLYVKKVNGIVADYDVDRSYWAFYINGEYATSGVDSTPITEGDTYQLVYTK